MKKAMPIRLAFVLACTLMCVLTLTGCSGPSEDPETVALRKKFVMAAEPADPLSLTKAAALVGVKPDSDATTKPETTLSAEDNAASDNAAPVSNAEPTLAEPEPSPVIADVSDVTLVGRIHAGQLEPWEEGKASFMLSELPEDGHGEGHDSDNCPFCKRRLAKAPTAIVKFVDAQGETLPIDSRKLFGLEKGQTVVVRGTVVAGEFNSIVMIANQMHVRTP